MISSFSNKIHHNVIGKNSRDHRQATLVFLGRMLFASSSLTLTLNPPSTLPNARPSHHISAQLMDTKVDTRRRAPKPQGHQGLNTILVDGIPEVSIVHCISRRHSVQTDNVIVSDTPLEKGCPYLASSHAYALAHTINLTFSLSSLTISSFFAISSGMSQVQLMYLPASQSRFSCVR